jgi:hypothetical protein
MPESQNHLLASGRSGCAKDMDGKPPFVFKLLLRLRAAHGSPGDFPEVKNGGGGGN